jgi:serine-type D-Ala-D-Ala carboxypeptidase/endopeptidase (penicillin-binding protein 4)
MSNRKLKFVLAAFLFLPTVLSLPTNTFAGSLEAIQTKIAQFLKRPGARNAQWGIEIFDPATNQVLVAVNADKTFKPASVLKVLTTAAAMEKLGANFRYHTTVYTDGEIGPDGTLRGNLILVGHGDPNLTDPYGEIQETPALEDLAEKLQALNIKKVVGDVIGDDSYFEDIPYGKGWTAKDLKTTYGAAINALSINNNVFWVHVRPGKYNGLVSVGVEPHTSYFKIRNVGITGSARSNRTVYARLIPGTRTIAVSGVLPAGQTYSQYILLEKPAEVAATMLKDEMQRQGISVTGHISATHRGDISPEDRRRWKPVVDHESVPLVRSLEIINKHSQNLHAEMLLRTLGAEFKGIGTDESGLEVIQQFLVDAGVVDNDKVRLNDGCGLSRDNLVTPRFQTSLLQFLAGRPYFDLFLNTLAVSGTDGTLRNRLSSRQVRGTIHAKTGTLNGVANLSGYMTTRSGHNLIFSIFTNNANATGRVKSTIDEICSLFVNLY